MASRYSVIETPKSAGGLTQEEINLGRFYVVDNENNSIVGKNFRTREEAQGHMYDLLTQR